MKHSDYFQVLIAVDQLINTFFGGMADETLTSRVHRLKIEWGRKIPSALINFLFFWQTIVKSLTSLKHNGHIFRFQWGVKNA